MAWRKTINIKQYLNQYDGDGGEVPIMTVAENIANELKSQTAAFGNLPDNLVTVTKEAIERIPEDEDYHQLAFNRVLGRIYDVADSERIWLGL